MSSFIVSCAFLALCVSVGESSNETDFEIWTEGAWDYYNFGPSTWSTYFSEYCGSEYTTQSGRIIDFDETVDGFEHIEDFILNTVDHEDTNFFHHWDFADDQLDWKMENTGHGLSVTAVSSDGSTYLNSNENAIAVLKNFFPANSDEHLYYCLYSFHMHWGINSSVGSEHNINGALYPMEMHFVHFSCNFSDISEAINEFSAYDDPLDLAVVGVLFELSEDGSNNTYLDKILSNIEQVTYVHQTHVVDDLNVKEMLDSFNNNSDFWYYEGSLTTPPCDPIVRWHVLEETMQIGEKQLDAFRTLLDHDNRTMHQNWRPTDTQENANQVYEFVFGTDNTYGDDDMATQGMSVSFLLVASLNVVVALFVVFN